jgi:SAM-dependent methyltransferase
VTGGAYVAWDAAWREASADNRWTRPQPEVRALVPLLRARGVRRVLDLGSGLGRHSRVLADEGFDVVAMDASPAGLARCRAAAGPGRPPWGVVLADMRGLPFADATFDYLLAWNVVYHGTDDQVAQAAGEIRRVLRVGGLYQCTMLSKRHARYGVGQRVGTGNAFVRPDDDCDKRYPHFYCDAAELLALHRGLEVLSLHDVDHRPQHPTRSGSFHWQVVFERLR